MDSLVISLKSYSERSKAGLDEISKLTPFAEKKEYLDAAINFVKSLGTDYEHINFVKVFPKPNEFGLTFKYLELNNLDQEEFPLVK